MPEYAFKELQLKKRLLRRCFPVNIAKFLRTSFFIEHPRWLPPVKIEPSLWNQQNFSSSYFWLHLIPWTPFTLWQNTDKTRYPQKNICRGIRSFCNSSFKSFRVILQWYVLNHRSFPVVLWNFFLNDLSVENTSLSINFIRRK